MKELADTDIAWRKGFEAGVAFTLKHYTKSGVDTVDICRFISDLEHLRPWKAGEDWKELIEKNTVNI